MFKTKAEVDKHVENCLNRINCEKQRITRGLNFARLYYNVGNYDLAKNYVSSYLSVRPESPEGHHLLGLTYEKLGKKGAALAAYKTSLNLEPKQNNLILKICELLADDDTHSFNVSEARNFCQLGEMVDQKNPGVNTLKEKLLLHNESNHETIIEILLKEVDKNPTNVNLQVRLLKSYVQNNKLSEAYKHVIDIESRNLLAFSTNLSWYEIIAEVLIGYKKYSQSDSSPNNSKLSWSFWSLFISVLDKLLSLKLDEKSSEMIRESSDYQNQLFIFDQALLEASKEVNEFPDRQLSAEFLRHFSGQLYLHYATVLFKNAKSDLIPFKEAAQITLPLLFAAFHTKPIDLQSVWINHLQEDVKKNVRRWNIEAAFRCSQAGHVLNAAAQNRKTVIMSKASQLSSGMWQETLYKKVFVARHQQLKSEGSYFVNNPIDVVLVLPSRDELLQYDESSFHVAPNLLSRYVWVAANQNLAELKFEPFVGLPYSVKNLTNCGAETLNLLDIQAFIYAATLCAKSHSENALLLHSIDLNRPKVLPVAVSGQLCTKEQEKFLVAAFRMYKNEQSSGNSDSGEVRLTLIRGIEIIRCVGRHGLDAALLVKLAEIFSKKSKKTNKQSEIDFNDARAELYWKTALPLLNKLKNNQAVLYAPNRMFTYKSKEMTFAKICSEIEKGNLFLGTMELKRKDYEKALNIFEELKDPYASFYQAQIYKQMAEQAMAQPSEDSSRNQTIFMSKSRDFLYLTLDRLRDPSVDKEHPLNTQLSIEIEKTERMISKLDPDVVLNRNCDGMSDDNDSSGETADLYTSTQSKSSPNLFDKSASFNTFSTPARTKKEARPSLERLDAQMRQLMLSENAVVSQHLERNKIVMDSLRNFADEMRNFKEYVTGQLDVFNSSMKTMMQDMRKENCEFKREIIELVKSNTSKQQNQNINDDLYVLDDEYSDYNTGLYQNYQSRIPQNIPPPAAAAAAAALYQQGLYPGLYGSIPSYGYPNLGLNQSSLPYAAAEQHQDFRALPGAIPTPPTAAAPTNTLYQPHQMVPASMNLSNSPFNSSAPLLSGQNLTPQKMVAVPPSPVVSKVAPPAPVNVVITSSDPLPTQMSSTTTQPVLSVTIPPQHIKGNKTATVTQPQPQPHNYQIPLPTTSSVSSTPSVLSKPAPSLSNTEGILSNVAPPVYSSLSTSVETVSSASSNEAPPARIELDKEVVMFECPAKLFKFRGEEFKEFGNGLFNLLEHKSKKTLRIFMKSDSGQILANHLITKDLKMASVKENSYYWSALDYAANGEQRSEKFCLRFKNAEDARKFDETFEKIKQSAATASTPSKSQFGGFMFSSGPVFKAETPTTPVQQTLPMSAEKKSPFANFSFGSSLSSNKSVDLGKLSLISKLSDNTSKSDNDDSSKADAEADTSRNNESVDDFVPTAEFQPVIPLPDIVDVKTGEENATVLFNCRAKLLRFDSELKEWKERGLGNMKILKEETLIRLLMRREIIHKICCNHQLLKSMNFQYMPNNLKALTWCAQDFSEEVLKTETYALRFKTEEQAGDFLKTILSAQSMLNDNNLLQSETANKSKPVHETLDKFKAPGGSWECKSCYIRNNSDISKCLACETPKEGDKPKQTTTVSSSSSWGDSFKPKEGSWECSGCFVRNESNVIKCVSCETPKDGSAAKEETKSTLKGVNLDTPFKFNFGIPSGNSSVTSTTSAIKSTLTNSSPASAAFKFGTSTPVSFSFGNGNAFSFNTAAKEKQQQPQQAKEEKSFVFGSTTSHSQFEFKPRSPRKSIGENNTGVDEESDGSFLEEECDTIFKPVIPLPDKVEVKTGEENEEILYCHRAKLFRFVNGEWKERGLGDLKILKNKTTGKLRVLMRREQVLKICLNHALNDTVEYLPKDDKTWLFTAADFSEGEVSHNQFCVRFKTQEVAQEFKSAVEKAKSTATVLEAENEDDNSDVEFVSESTVTPEEIAGAEKLKLPSKFFAYRQLPSCECEQCKEDDEYFKGTIFDETKNSAPAESSFETFSFIRKNDENAAKDSPPVSSSTTVSGNLFGSKLNTPNIFGSGGGTSAFSFKPQNTTSNSSGTTENKSAISTNLFGSSTPVSNSKSIFESSNTNSTTSSIFGSSTTNSTSSIFGASPSIFHSAVSNTTSSNIFGTPSSKSVEPAKSIFGSVNSGSSFGTNTSLFGNNAKFEFGQNGKSIFGQAVFGQNTKEDSTKNHIAVESKNTDEVVFKCKSDVTFSSLAAQQNIIAPEFKKNSEADITQPFAFLGAGAPVFGSAKKKDAALNSTKDSASGDGDEEDNNENDENYDPHYDPIIPMPDAIVVSTGEEDETALFNERAKLFRFDAELKEWKERGVGQMKILHHPTNGTYRFLLRREQVHKVVLNQLITPSLELQPMSSSDKAWVWAGHNYVEDEMKLEKLAVRFKSQEQAKIFYNSVESLLKTLKEKEILPASIQNYGVENVSSDSDQQNYDDDEEDDDPYDEDYDGERSIRFSHRCVLSECVNGQWMNVCNNGVIQIYYDPESFCSKISYIADDGEVLSYSVIGVNTVMKIEGKQCTWKSVELSYEEANWRELKAIFDSAEFSQQFYDNYIEGLSYAQEFEVIDDIPSVVDNDDAVSVE